MESKSAFELSDNLKNAFAVFIDVKEFKIFLFDEILNSLKEDNKSYLSCISKDTACFA